MGVTAVETGNNARSGWRIVLLNSLLWALGPVTVDLSLPALPAIQQSIGTPAMQAELSLTAVLLGMAVAQFLIGAVADTFGRRLPLLAALALFAAGGLACAAAPSVQLLVLSRFLQALGLGVAVVMSRSVVADVYDGRGVARAFSTAVMATAVTTVAAPFIGGQVLQMSSWRALPLIMSAAGILCLVYAAALVPETLPVERRRPGGFGHLINDYLVLLRNPVFSSCALIAGSAGAAQFCYNTGAASVLIERYGLTASSCGLYLSIIALSMAVTSQINGWLLRWFTPARILAFAVPAALGAAAVLYAVAASGAGGVSGLVIALLLNIGILGFIIPNAMAGGMISAGPHAGAASALLGVLMFAFGTIGSALVGAANDTSGRWMALAICAWAILAATQMWRLRRQEALLPERR